MSLSSALATVPAQNLPLFAALLLGIGRCLWLMSRKGDDADE